MYFGCSQSGYLGQLLVSCTYSWLDLVGSFICYCYKHFWIGCLGRLLVTSTHFGQLEVILDWLSESAFRCWYALWVAYFFGAVFNQYYAYWIGFLDQMGTISHLCHLLITSWIGVTFAYSRLYKKKQHIYIGTMLLFFHCT